MHSTCSSHVIYLYMLQYYSDPQDDQSIHSIGSSFIIGSDMSSIIDPHESQDALSQVDDSDLQPIGYGHHVSTPVRSVHVMFTNVHVCAYNYSVQGQNL